MKNQKKLFITNGNRQPLPFIKEETINKDLFIKFRQFCHKNDFSNKKITDISNELLCTGFNNSFKFNQLVNKILTRRTVNDVIIFCINNTTSYEVTFSIYLVPKDAIKHLITSTYDYKKSDQVELNANYIFDDKYIYNNFLLLLSPTLQLTIVNSKDGELLIKNNYYIKVADIDINHQSNNLITLKTPVDFIQSKDLLINKIDKLKENSIKLFKFKNHKEKYTVYSKVDGCSFDFYSSTNLNKLKNNECFAITINDEFQQNSVLYVKYNDILEMKELFIISIDDKIVKGKTIL